MSAAISLPNPGAPAAPTVPVPVAELFDIVSEAIEAGRFDRADRLVDQVLAAFPSAADALHTKGLIAARRKRFAEAVGWMERGAAAGGRRAGQLRNLSEAYRVMGRLDDALAAARQAVAADPADANGPFNLAMLHYDRMELDPCIRAARHALQLKGNMAAAHMKLAQALLLKGGFEEGWAEYEWRYQIPGAQKLMPATDRKQWNGEALAADQRLLLVADQGYGDVVMFARYVPWVLSRCRNVAVACSNEMLPVLRRTFPRLTLFNNWGEIGSYHVFCPLSGLPRLHGTRLDTIPAPTPYFTADPERAARWRAQLDAQAPRGAKRVGIAWAGRPTHNNDHNRTTTLANFAPLGDVPGIVLVSLQKGEAARETASWSGRTKLLDLGGALETFEDTMAVIDGLDLTVVVDTAIGHFAGAMNRPVWIMVPFAPDWRWLTDRADSPWYPSVRLFRHPATRRWDLVIAAVAASLRQLVAR
ncbi:MAG: tetratricopeptide repeat protein [Acetobacteraceae bacterium]|nr:tetratricopeptide repeat protein [Acetobacteraceae bacterium]